MGKAMRIVRELCDEHRVLRSKDLATRKLSAGWLTLFPRAGFWQLDRKGPGLYVRHEQKTDRILLVARKYPSLTLGLTSALWLAKVLPARPSEDFWVLGPRDWMPGWAPPGTRYVRSRRARDHRIRLLVEKVPVPVHLPLHALLDCIRFRSVLGEPQLLAAIEGALASGIISIVELLAASRGAKLWQATIDALLQLGVNLHTSEPIEATSLF